MSDSTAENNRKIKLLAVVGPTASGKTGLAVELAKQYRCEVVSCDSMQIYKELSVSTARPTQEEMQGIPHHLIGHVSLSEEYSVARYVKEAKEAIDDIISRGKTPLLCGGTGLYFSSLVDSVKFSDAAPDKSVREQLKSMADEKGGAVLLEMLRQVDPVCAERLHENDTGRIIRALEIFKTTGITMTEHDKRSKLIPSPYEVCALLIDYSDREILYDRINRRVDIMLENGILEEAQAAIVNPDIGPTASQAIGVKEFIPYFNGDAALEECAEILKKETRHYAKRQLTWFRRDERINRINVLPDDTPQQILKKAQEIIEKFI